MHKLPFTSWTWIVAGVFSGLALDAARSLPWTNWSARYGKSVDWRKFEEDLRTHRPGTENAKSLVVYSQQTRELDGSKKPVNIVVSSRVDHFEYRHGQPAPMWEQVCFVAAVPYISYATHKTYPTVKAFLDDPLSGGGAGPVPYFSAWWTMEPASALLYASAGALLIGVLWPLAIRHAKDVRPYLIRLSSAMVASLRGRARLPAPASAVHPPGSEATIRETAAPDLKELDALNESLESGLSDDAALTVVKAAATAPAPVAELAADPSAPVAPPEAQCEAEFGAEPADFYPTVVHAHQTGPKSRHGFILGDLIVVLGVIGILAAIAFPIISSVRARAAQITCMESLRRMSTAAQAHMKQHEGYLPICGRHWQWALINGEMTPSGLGDSSASHYVYYTDGGVKRPAPITAALAVSLGMQLGRGSRAALTADLQSAPMRNLFRCPAQDPPGHAYSLGTDQWESPDEYNSYVFNEALLCHRSVRPMLPQGQPARVRVPASMFFAMDGEARERFLNVGEMNLVAADLLMFRQREGQCVDYTRHANQANVLFVDWHAASIPLTTAGLQSIVIAEMPASLSEKRMR